MSIVAKCCQQSTVDRRLSITLIVQLCAQHTMTTGCDATRRAVRRCQPRLVECQRYTRAAPLTVSAYSSATNCLSVRLSVCLSQLGGCTVCPHVTAIGDEYRFAA